MSIERKMITMIFVTSEQTAVTTSPPASKDLSWINATVVKTLPLSEFLLTDMKFELTNHIPNNDYFALLSYDGTPQYSLRMYEVLEDTVELRRYDNSSQSWNVVTNPLTYRAKKEKEIVEHAVEENETGITVIITE